MFLFTILILKNHTKTKIIFWETILDDGNRIISIAKCENACCTTVNSIKITRRLSDPPFSSIYITYSVKVSQNFVSCHNIRPLWMLQERARHSRSLTVRQLLTTSSKVFDRPMMVCMVSFYISCFDNTLENCFFQCCLIHIHIILCIICEMAKGKFPWECHMIYMEKIKHARLRGLFPSNNYLSSVSATITLSEWWYFGPHR